MGFFLSKVAWFLATPSNLLVVLGLVGVLAALSRRRARLGRALCALSLVGILLAGIAPVGTWLLAPLEDRFPAFADDGKPIVGIIVLGGAILPNLSFARRQLVMGDSSERIVALADLARRHPQYRLIFSGGSGSILGDDAPEAAALARFGATLGFEPARVTYERTSRTTHENAVETRKLVPPDADGRWILVTSAWHMPRSVGAFRAAGIDVVPYPVDYRTAPDRMWRPEPSIASGLDRVDIGAREWIGLAFYRVARRSSALFPAP